MSLKLYQKTVHAQINGFYSLLKNEAEKTLREFFVLDLLHVKLNMMVIRRERASSQV